MENLIGIKKVNVVDGQIVDNANRTALIPDTLTVDVNTAAPVDISQYIKEYKELDEDELFDYEKTVVTYTVGRQFRSIIIEGDKMTFVDRAVGTRFAPRSLSPSDFVAAAESQVYKLSEVSLTLLTWAEMQVPGVYVLEDGTYSVFIDNDNKPNYTKGDGLVYYSPATPNDAPILNTELSTRREADVHAEREAERTQQTVADLANSPEIQRMREALRGN